jgi:hypothetical protein
MRRILTIERAVDKEVCSRSRRGTFLPMRVRSEGPQGHRSKGTDMRRMQIQHRSSRRDTDPRPLSLDPRDPDVLRAKQLKRGASRTDTRSTR